MTQFVIAIVLAIWLLAIGSTLVGTSIALIIVFAFSRGSVIVHRWIEKKTHRTVPCRSERYAAAYFGIALGLGAFFTNILDNAHILVQGSAVLGGFVLAGAVAHAAFGEPATTEGTVARNR